MAHATDLSAYGRLSERLNRFPQGAPPSALLFSILKMLFSEREAGLVSRLPIRPFTAADAARAWKTSVGSAAISSIAAVRWAGEPSSIAKSGSASSRCITEAHPSRCAAARYSRQSSWVQLASSK